MCNNYRSLKESELLRQKFGVRWEGNDLDPNVFPGMLAPIIRRPQDSRTGEREAVTARFGLLPRFAKSEKLKFSTANARTEGAPTAASFKGPFHQRQWCIIPADRFYEPYYDVDRWNAGVHKSERYAIWRDDQEPFGIAGLWERWKRAPDDKNPVLSFTMLTIDSDAHPLLYRFHKPFDDDGRPNEKRTIVLLRPQDYDAWLDATPEEASKFFHTFGAEELKAGPEPLPVRPKKPKVMAPIANSTPETLDLFSGLPE